MPRQTPSASDYTSVVRSSAVANDVASKPAGTPGAAKASAAAVRSGGGLGSLGAIGSIVKQSVVAKAIAPPVVAPTAVVIPVVAPLSATAGLEDTFIVCYDTNGIARWAAKIASSGSDIAYGISTDLNGNVYVSGQGGNGTITAYHASGVAFTTTLTNIGGGDAFVVKYNSTGTVQWVAKVASGVADISYAITTDPSGNVYVTGPSGSDTNMTAYNSDSSSFGTTIGNSGSSDAFIVKYNTNGFVQWVTRLGSIQWDGGWSICTDPSGNLYVGGEYGGPLTAYNSDSSSFSTVMPNVGWDAFIAKYNSSGFVQWVARLSTSGTERVYNLTTDNDGNLYVAGLTGTDRSIVAYNSDSSSFIPGLAAAGGSDAYVAKYNSSGFVQWIARIATTVNDSAWGLATDSSGNVYVTGEAGPDSTLTAYSFDATPFGTTLTSLGSTDCYIVKYNTNGVVQWVARVGSTSNDRGWDLATDANDNVYVVGQTGTATAAAYNASGPSFSKRLTNAGLDDAFIVKYSPTGTVQWFANMAGTDADIARAVAIDKTGGKVYVAGQFKSTSFVITNA